MTNSQKIVEDVCTQVCVQAQAGTLDVVTIDTIPQMEDTTAEPLDPRYVEAALAILECLDRNIQKVRDLRLKFCQEDEITRIRQRLSYIDDALKDYFISWNTTKRLLQEQTELEAQLRELGYEP